MIFADFNLPFVSAQFVSILIVLKGSALTYTLPSFKLLAAVEMNRWNNEINIRTDLLRVHSLFHITIANFNPVDCSSALLANQRRKKGKVFDKPREVNLSVDWQLWKY